MGGPCPKPDLVFLPPVIFSVYSMITNTPPISDYPAWRVQQYVIPWLNLTFLLELALAVSLTISLSNRKSCHRTGTPSSVKGWKFHKNPAGARLETSVVKGAGQDVGEEGVVEFRVSVLGRVSERYLFQGDNSIS